MSNESSQLNWTKKLNPTYIVLINKICNSSPAINNDLWQGAIKADLPRGITSSHILQCIPRFLQNSTFKDLHIVLFILRMVCSGWLLGELTVGNTLRNVRIIKSADCQIIAV